MIEGCWDEDEEYTVCYDQLGNVIDIIPCDKSSSQQIKEEESPFED